MLVHSDAGGLGLNVVRMAPYAVVEVVAAVGARAEVSVQQKGGLKIG